MKKERLENSILSAMSPMFRCLFFRSSTIRSLAYRCMHSDAVTYKVVLHARHVERGRDAIKKSPQAESFLTGDLSNIEETRNLAHEVNKS